MSFDKISKKRQFEDLENSIAVKNAVELEEIKLFCNKKFEYITIESLNSNQLALLNDQKAWGWYLKSRTANEKK